MAQGKTDLEDKLFFGPFFNAWKRTFFSNFIFPHCYLSHERDLKNFSNLWGNTIPHFRCTLYEYIHAVEVHIFSVPCEVWTPTSDVGKWCCYPRNVHIQWIYWRDSKNKKCNFGQTSFETPLFSKSIIWFILYGLIMQTNYLLGPLWSYLKSCRYLHI